MDLTAARRYLQEREDIAFAYLFGSMATGKTTPLSDVDIAVYLIGGDLPQKRLELIGDLCDRLGTDRLDLVILNTAPPGLRARVVRSKRVLAERMPTKRHAFESRTLREYMDFSKLENRILEQRYRHG
jgi:hypothetical protein